MSNKKIVVSLPDSYVNRNSVDDYWDEIELFITRGFLTCKMSIKDLNVVFKTVNHKEISLINDMYFYNENKKMDAYIAFSIFMMNGVQCLINRDETINRVVDLVGGMDTSVKNEIVSKLSHLNMRSNRLHKLVEFYAYEPRSRYKWLSVKGTRITDENNTGVPGTSRIGMNYCQESWVALSTIIDIKNEVESNWTNAKFVGSCFAGKAIKEVYDRDNANKENEIKEREERKASVLSTYINSIHGVDNATQKRYEMLPDGRRAEIVSKNVAETAEQLADQLSMALSGEKDEHDRIVEMEIKKIRERENKINERIETMYTLTNNISNFDEDNPSIRVITEEEAKALIKKSNERVSSVGKL